MTTVQGERILRAHPAFDAANTAKTCAFQSPNNDRGLFKFRCLDTKTPCEFKSPQPDGKMLCVAITKN